MTTRVFFEESMPLRMLSKKFVIVFESSQQLSAVASDLSKETSSTSVTFMARTPRRWTLQYESWLFEWTNKTRYHSLLYDMIYCFSPHSHWFVSQQDLTTWKNRYQIPDSLHVLIKVIAHYIKLDIIHGGISEYDQDYKRSFQELVELSTRSLGSRLIVYGLSITDYHQLLRIRAAVNHKNKR